MKAHQISYKDTGFSSKIILDYFEENPLLETFYENNANKNGFKNQITLKEKSYDNAFRKVLVDELSLQNKSVSLSKKSALNIQLLSKKNSFTITTGHQLNIFTGPLFVIYKIISIINLTKYLKKQFPNCNFVPVFWMASEDHDFEEINHINLPFSNHQTEKITWQTNQKGAVGRMGLKKMNVVLEALKTATSTAQTDNLLEIFKKAYAEHSNLSEATRYIFNELFGKHGLVVLNGDSKKLKQLFIPHIKDELFSQKSFEHISKTTLKIQENYKPQINPRAINLFYLKNNLRERIIFNKTNNTYTVLNTAIVFSSSEMLDEINKHPENFSPNALMRPLYQEVLLPNLCTIGGGGELAYWLQLKLYFEASKVSFPILLHRNSVLLLSKKQARKCEKLQLSYTDLFLKSNQLINKTIQKHSEIKLNFNTERAQIEAIFSKLKKLASQTDASFIGAVLAQQKKQLKGLEKLEKRLLKAQKKKMYALVTQVNLLHNELFPNQQLEERIQNITTYYQQYGPNFIDDLLKILDPLEQKFSVVTY